MTASVDQMEFRSTSRRDDLKSLVYLAVYLLNRSLPWKYKGTEEPYKLRKKNLKAKIMYTYDKLCVKKALTIKNFAAEIFNLKYDQKPDYDHLKQLLESSINDL